MGTRPRLAAACMLALTALSGCGKQGCTDLPLDSGIQVQVPSAIQQLVKTFRVELCQSGQCKAVEFTRDAERADGSALNGVSFTHDAYDVDLGLLGTGWKAGTSSKLTVTGLTRSGRQIVAHSEKFTFDAAYPNGEGCDDSPELTHSTSLGASDIQR